MDKLKVGFALTGSFCTFDKAINQIESFISKGTDVLPIMSFNAYHTDTRFGKASDFIERIESITGNKIISTIKTRINQ